MAEPLATAAGWGLALALGLGVATWLASLPLRDASIADRVWSAFVAAPPVLYAAWGHVDARAAAMLAIVLAWAVRLAAYITARNRGHGEDRRYRDMRARHGAGFPLKSLWLVFGLQAAIAWVVGWPLLAALQPGGRPWGALDTVGAVLALTGLLVEAVADAQLARFRRDARNAGRVMDRGLWRWSRHPNYFGETCLWWGLGAMGLAAGGWTGAVALASPVVMTVLLLRVSGVTLLEQDIADRRPAYRDYVARTSAFVPWPPRRSPQP